MFTAEVEGGAITSCDIILEHSSATPTAFLNNLKDALTGKTALDCGCECGCGCGCVGGLLVAVFLVCHCDHVHLPFQTHTHKHIYIGLQVLCYGDLVFLRCFSSYKPPTVMKEQLCHG